MRTQSAQVIDMEEYRQRRVARSERAHEDDREKPSRKPAAIPVALFWFPMWTWMPVWQMR